jgi:hypothetical protein
MTQPRHEDGASPEERRSFLDILPSEAARTCFRVWRAARRDNASPSLFDFAPLHLPRAVLPWILIHRLKADGELIYGLAGEEVVRWFGENPKGKPFLGHIEPAERAARLALIMQVITSGLPMWFLGTLLLENQEHVPVGRLVLPAVDNDEQVVLIVYFLLREPSAPHLRIVGQPSFSLTHTDWCRPEDLVG